MPAIVLQAVLQMAQLILPLLLLIWLAVWPARGWLAYTLQVIAVAGTLTGLWLTAIWAMPPFWVPYGLLGIFLTVVVFQFFGLRWESTAPWDTGILATLLILVVSVSGCLGLYVTVRAWQGTLLPAVPTVDISAPFPSGTYLVANGGSTTAVNNHLQTLDPTVPRFSDFRGQSRALDIFRISSLGFHVEGWRPEDPGRYLTFAAPLTAPCDGTVARVVDGVPDNRVPRMNREQMAGNYVAIDCGGFYLILAHLRLGSVRVREGQQVAIGDALGQMGNSGNSSEPHLHIHAQRDLPDGSPLSGEPLALTIDSRFLVRNDRFTVTGR